MSYLTGGHAKPSRWPVYLIVAGVIVGFWTGIAAVIWWLV